MWVHIFSILSRLKPSKQVTFKLSKVENQRQITFHPLHNQNKNNDIPSQYRSMKRSRNQDASIDTSKEDPQKRHDTLVGHLSAFYAPKLESKGDGDSIVTDYDVLKHSYRFLRSEADDSKEVPSIVRSARRYYDRLFKEYALCDVSRVSSKSIGLRWRTHKECVEGKGQFSCGSLGCDNVDGLESYEVPFKYREAGESKHALVKIRVCPPCASLLTTCGDARALSREKQKRRKQKSSSSKARKSRRQASDDEDLFL